MLYTMQIRRIKLHTMFFQPSALRDYRPITVELESRDWSDQIGSAERQGGKEEKERRRRGGGEEGGEEEEEENGRRRRGGRGGEE